MNARDMYFLPFSLHLSGRHALSLRAKCALESTYSATNVVELNRVRINCVQSALLLLYALSEYAARVYLYLCAYYFHSFRFAIKEKGAAAGNHMCRLVLGGAVLQPMDQEFYAKQQLFYLLEYSVRCSHSLLPVSISPSTGFPFPTRMTCAMCRSLHTIVCEMNWSSWLALRHLHLEYGRVHGEN